MGGGGLPVLLLGMVGWRMRLMMAMDAFFERAWQMIQISNRVTILWSGYIIVGIG